MTDVFIKVEVVNSVEIVLSTETGTQSLQTTWNNSEDAVKDSFVDNNQAEILLFINGEIIILSTEASFAIVNIQSNGGVLTNQEKLDVSVWVDRLVSNGDWTTLNALAYGGFNDNLCSLTDWITGKLMELVGTASFSGGGWLFPLAADYLRTNFTPSIDAIKGTFKDHSTGSFLVSATGHPFTPLDVEFTGNFGSRFRMTAFDSDTWRLASSSSSLSSTELNDPIPLSNSLFSFNLEDASPTLFQAYTNGIKGVNRNANPFDYAQDIIQVGINSPGAIFNLFYDSAREIDLVDFTNGFNLFNKTFSAPKGWDAQIAEYGRGYHYPQPTGNTTIYRSGDDADIEATIFAPIRVANSLKVSNSLIDFMTLGNNNSFGNRNRFTDINGLQVYGDDYIIDNYTGLGWYRVWQNALLAIWNNGIDQAISSSVLGFTDWFLENVNQVKTIMKHNISNSMLYPPFNISTTNILTSTIPFNASKVLVTSTNSTIVIVNKNGIVGAYLLCRKHF